MHLIHLPQLGYTMESGTIVAWLHKEGDAVSAGEALYEVETQKNTVEVEARLPGTLLRVVGEVGTEYTVGALLAVVADPGESPTDEEVNAALEAAHPPTPEPGARPSAAPAATPSAGAERNEGSGKVRALPKVRAFAAERGIDLSVVPGTGARGAVTMDDVTAWLRSQGAAQPSGGPVAVLEERPVGAVGRAMASNLTRSWREVPQFVQQFRVDLTAITAFRAERREAGERIGLTDLLVAAIAHAAQEVPEANASFAGDHVVLYRDVNVAVAVATDRGLLVPVLPRAQELDLAGIGAQLGTLIDRARSGESEETTAASITLSNLGQSAVETGTPLVTHPQSAIVFAGATVDTPVAVDGTVVVRPLLGMAVAYDHRVVDGAIGAAFCTTLQRLLQHPEALVAPAVAR